MEIPAEGTGRLRFNNDKGGVGSGGGSSRLRLGDPGWLSGTVVL